MNNGLRGNEIVGLISAVPFEGAGIIKKLARTDKGKPLIPIYSGRISGLKIVYATSGLGQVNAAHAATVLIHNYAPSLIINFGVGGAYPDSGLKTGESPLKIGRVGCINKDRRAVGPACSISFSLSCLTVFCKRSSAGLFLLLRRVLRGSAVSCSCRKL